MPTLLDSGSQGAKADSPAERASLPVPRGLPYGLLSNITHSG